MDKLIRKEEIPVLISELSDKTGVSIRSLRYYEEKELIAPQRLENGYREYDDTDIERVKMIQLFLDLGLRTDEIAPILACSSGIPAAVTRHADAPAACASEAIDLYEGKLRDARKQIAALKEAEAKLEELLAFWKKIKRQGKVK